MSSRIYPVILCGGSGKRLWPLSRTSLPKQFLPLTSDMTLFQETLLRLKLDAPESKQRFGQALVIANRDHEAIIRAQLGAIGLASSAVLLEPVGRNTAPAAAAAALWVKANDPEGIVLLLPADHFIADVQEFQACIGKAAAAAEAGLIATFGIAPTSPETGYGYIEQGGELGGPPGVYAVARFVEKPKLKNAERYLESGRFTWNSGMFCFRCTSLLAEMEMLCPVILERTVAALPVSFGKSPNAAFDERRFAEVPSEAIDTAVMEHTRKAAVIPAAIGWSDVGSFAALWSVGARDDSGNLARGDVVLRNAAGCYVNADSRFVAVIGVEDLVIVETADVVLVVKRSQVQHIKSLVEQLEESGRADLVARRNKGQH